MTTEEKKSTELTEKIFQDLVNELNTELADCLAEIKDIQKKGEE